MCVEREGREKEEREMVMITIGWWWWWCMCVYVRDRERESPKQTQGRCWVNDHKQKPWPAKVDFHLGRHQLPRRQKRHSWAHQCYLYTVGLGVGTTGERHTGFFLRGCGIGWGLALRKPVWGEPYAAFAGIQCQSLRTRLLGCQMSTPWVNRAQLLPEEAHLQQSRVTSHLETRSV